MRRDALLATEMAQATKPSQDRKRVKVYELRDNDWFDRGTGFCTGEVINVSPLTSLPRPCHTGPHVGLGDSYALQLRKETDNRTWMMQDVPKIFVESEDEKGRYLLETEIGKEEGYQKQQGLTIGSWLARATRKLIGSTGTETLIVWTELNGTDMALSFQEADGCAAIWYVSSGRSGFGQWTRTTDLRLL